jgi:hypothetical protein
MGSFMAASAQRDQVVEGIGSAMRTKLLVMYFEIRC